MAQRIDEYSADTAGGRAVVTWFNALMKKDFGLWRSVVTEDLVQENPYMPELPGTPSHFENRDRLEFHLKTVLEKRRNHVFFVLSLYEDTSRNMVVAEIAGRSEVPETGQVYDQRYVVFATIRDGRVCHIREYFNPLVFQNAFKGFLVGEGAVHN